MPWPARVCPRSRGQQVHAQLRLRLVDASDADLRRNGDAPQVLNKPRNAASYDLAPLPRFASAKVARADVQLAADAVALPDSIDGDATRRTAAIGSIRP